MFPSINWNYITHPPPLYFSTAVNPHTPISILPSSVASFSHPAITAPPVRWQCYRSPEASSHQGVLGGWRRPRCAAAQTSHLEGREDEESVSSCGECLCDKATVSEAAMLIRLLYRTILISIMWKNSFHCTYYYYLIFSTKALDSCTASHAPWKWLKKTFCKMLRNDWQKQTR